jgi:hypothetical protein
MAKFKTEYGDWVHFRERFALSETDEVNLHFGPRDGSTSYYEAMAEIEMLVNDTLCQAQEDDRPYLMFVHGHSTSGLGKTTTRSVVRGFMRSKAATPLIVRAECIQHPTVFVAKIKKKMA